MAAVAVPPELWSEFNHELDTLIDGAKAAEDSYTAGRGMSLASIAVGSAVMRLSKASYCVTGNSAGVEIRDDSSVDKKSGQLDIRL